MPDYYSRLLALSYSYLGLSLAPFATLAAKYRFYQLCLGDFGHAFQLGKILFGLPMSDLTLSKWRKLAFPSSLARFYQEQGYQSSYITGGNKNWHDLDLVLGAQ